MATWETTGTAPKFDATGFLRSTMVIRRQVNDEWQIASNRDNSNRSAVRIAAETPRNGAAASIACKMTITFYFTAMRVLESGSEIITRPGRCESDGDPSFASPRSLLSACPE